VRKARGSYRVKESSKLKLMAYYKEVNNGKLDKLGKTKRNGKQY